MSGHSGSGAICIFAPQLHFNRVAGFVPFQFQMYVFLQSPHVHLRTRWLYPTITLPPNAHDISRVASRHGFTRARVNFSLQESIWQEKMTRSLNT
jgi:hypothetical protein